MPHRHPGPWVLIAEPTTPATLSSQLLPACAEELEDAMKGCVLSKKSSQSKSLSQA